MYQLSFVVTPKDKSTLNDFIKYLVGRYPAGYVDTQLLAIDVYLVVIDGIRPRELAVTFLHGITVNNMKVTEY